MYGDSWWREKNILAVTFVRIWRNSPLFIPGYPPMVDLLANLPMDPNALLGNFSFEGSDDVTAHEFISLPSLMKRAVTAPLTAQWVVSLVNIFEKIDCKSCDTVDSHTLTCLPFNYQKYFPNFEFLQFGPIYCEYICQNQVEQKGLISQLSP